MILADFMLVLINFHHKILKNSFFTEGTYSANRFNSFPVKALSNTTKPPICPLKKIPI